MAKTADTIERGKRLVEARVLKGWNQKKLIEETGLDRSTVSKHENGTAIPTEKARVYAKALGNIEPDDLAEVLSPSVLRRLESIELLLASLVPPGLLEDSDALARAEKMASEARARLQPQEPDETHGSG